jgi:glycosyltransferase involved in cell wall biosynthesis
MSVTFALICYNQEKFIREAIRGALAQDYEPLEILVSDDHSTDATFDIIQEEVAGYAGPHTIRLVRNTENIGFENFARTAEAAHGEFLVSAHGDDVSHPSRTRRLMEVWRATNASLLSSNAEVIDAASHVLKPLTSQTEPKWIPAAEIAVRGYVSEADGATLAWHRDVFGEFGRLDERRLRGAYDHVLPFRAGLLNGAYYVPWPLLQRRSHGANYGLESEDRTRGNLVMKETRSTHNLGAKICMLEDLDYFRERNPCRTDLIAINEVLVAAILDVARKANGARNELFSQGLRPTWIDAAEMQQRAGYAKGHLGTSNTKQKARRFSRVRRLAGILKQRILG